MWRLRRLFRERWSLEMGGEALKGVMRAMPALMLKEERKVF